MDKLPAKDFFNKNQRRDTLKALNRDLKSKKWIIDKAIINDFNQLMIILKSPNGNFGRAHGFKLADIK